VEPSAVEQLPLPMLALVVGLAAGPWEHHDGVGASVGCELDDSGLNPFPEQAPLTNVFFMCSVCGCGEEGFSAVCQSDTVLLSVRADAYSLYLI